MGKKAILEDFIKLLDEIDGFMGEHFPIISVSCHHKVVLMTNHMALPIQPVSRHSLDPWNPGLSHLAEGIGTEAQTVLLCRTELWQVFDE